MEPVRVAAESHTHAVAGAIAGIFRDHQRVEVQAIGAGAVNQAVKAIILATGYLQEEGSHTTLTAVFVDLEINDSVKTGIKFIIEPKPGDLGASPEQEKTVQE